MIVPRKGNVARQQCGDAKKYYPTKELVRGKHICWVPSLSVNYKLTHAQGHKWFIPLRNTRAYKLHYKHHAHFGDEVQTVNIPISFESPEQ